MFFIIEEVKETVLDFLFCFNIISIKNDFKCKIVKYTEVTLNLLSKLFGKSNDETNF